MLLRELQPVRAALAEQRYDDADKLLADMGVKTPAQEAAAKLEAAQLRVEAANAALALASAQAEVAESGVSLGVKA
jgi:erythromycin esterase-like protein